MSKCSGPAGGEGGEKEADASSVAGCADVAKWTRLFFLLRLDNG